MIKITQTDNGKVTVEQYAQWPTVYLDNWAINYFALYNPDIGKEFVEILNKCLGCITVSIIHLAEVNKGCDDSQFKIIMNFLDSMDFVLIETDPSVVIKKERKPNNPSQSPAAATDLLNAYCSTMKPTSFSNVSDIFTLLREEKILLKTNFASQLNPIIDQARNDPEKLEAARKRFKAPLKPHFPCTDDLYSRVFAYITINKAMKMPEKEWLDILHLIVASSYCDFVLADSRWVEYIKSTGMRSPYVAQVFSQRQLNEFINALKNYIPRTL